MLEKLIKKIRCFQSHPSEKCHNCKHRKERHIVIINAKTDEIDEYSNAFCDENYWDSSNYYFGKYYNEYDKLKYEFEKPVDKVFIAIPKDE